jgi:ParB family chromosome partitioning protein
MAKKKTAPVKLSVDDYEPLLVAISSRAVDTCLMGAKCLALLEDPRAFGLLMQLSREDEGSVRLETCRSFAQLGDRRAVDRLCTLLVDVDAKVRDAAYTALQKISRDEPLIAAEHGLASDFEDVRRRGLETLVRSAKKSELRKVDEPAGQLLKQALSDSVAPVRMEAFKFVLNSNVGGGQDATLRFLLTSAHADVRREVLNEVMAEDKQLWSETMMFEMLSDPDSGIRSEAFEFLNKKYDKDQTGWLSEAIRSSHVDIRKQACERLIKIGNSTAQATLALAINDEDSEIRQLALQSLVAKGATDSLVTALESSYLGVRLAAAKALAQNGDERCKEVLLTIAGEDCPESESEQKLWEPRVCEALGGLLMLGDSETVEFLVERCGHKNEEVRHHAANALKWTADLETVDLIQPLLQHEDDKVRLPAAVACGLHGDLISARLVISPLGKDSPLENKDRLTVAAALGDDTENQLVQLLDVQSIPLANSALLILLCRDWLKHDGTPRRILAALAARDARIRLVAAKALQAFADPERLGSVIAEVFNDRSENDEWTVEPEVVRQIAEMLVFSRPHVQCRAISLLSRLNEAKQKKWDFGWLWFSNRFEKELEAAKSAAGNQKFAKLTVDQSTLDQLAFGTYVGLAREQGGFHYRKYWPRFGWSVETVRLAAVRKLFDLSPSSDEFHEAAVSVLTHTCTGPWASVRVLAFEKLKELGVDDTRRAEVGISSSKFDLAVKGLELLTASASAAKRKEVLSEAILNQPRIIAIEAAKMLREDVGSVKTCEVCLDSSNDSVKKTAVAWVAEDYADSAAAKKLLRQLAADAPLAIRTVAMEQLVNQRDESAFDAIAEDLKDANSKLNRGKCYKWLRRLQDERTSDFLLSLLDEQQPDVDAAGLLSVIGEFRDPSACSQLLENLDHKDWATHVTKALVQISGFDQRIHDPNDLRAHDRSWMDAQHARRGEVLALLLDRTIELGQVNRAKALIASARWCLTDEVNSPLERLCSSSDEATRVSACEAISFRGEHRGASVEVLKSVVGHRDPMTQLLAAEGLAKAGQDDGLAVLMSAVEMMEDLRLRRRAVLAIGRLGSERGLDVLLKLVTHEAHALQPTAAEAIGYLGQSGQKEKIFGILNSLVAQEGTAGTRAIVGLRHMNTPEAWNVIRSKAGTTSHSLSRAVVIQQLGYDPSSETQDLLVDLLERYPNDMDTQLAAARRSFGSESIVPDIAFLKGRNGNRGELTSPEVDSLNRVCDRATPEQILELTSRCPSRARAKLTTQLLLMDEPPIKEALKELESPSAATVELAAKIVGRSGEKKHAKPIGLVLLGRLEKYTLESQRLRRQNETESRPFLQDRAALISLVWAAGRLGGSGKALLSLLTENQSSSHFANLRIAAIRGLVNEKLTAAMEADLRVLLSDLDPEIRKAASEMLIAKSKKPEDVGEALISDRYAFDNLSRTAQDKVEPVLKTAARSSHYQPRALLQLAKSGDHKTLATVAEDVSIDLRSRLGAIEGLAKIANSSAEKVLVSLGKSANLPELKKAAWRGLRRSKRAGAKS